MRLQQLASATALVLLVTPFLASLAAPPAAAAASPPSLSWVSPTEGGRVEPNGTVTLLYVHDGGTGAVAGEARLDGQRVGTFVVDATGNSTFVTFRIDASGIPLGTHTFEASAWTARDAAVDAPPIDVDLVAYDARPTLAWVNGTYDFDAGAFVVTGHVDDPDGPTLNLALQVQGIGSVNQSGAPADFTLALPAPATQRAYNATLLYDDGVKGGATSFVLRVPNRPPTLSVTNVSHELGGRLVVTGLTDDADGRVVAVQLATPYGVASTTPRNGTFRVEVTGFLAAGSVPGVVRALDNQGASTFANVTFDVVALHGKAYERNASLGLGASVEAGATAPLPVVRNATLSLRTTGSVEGVAVVDAGPNATQPLTPGESVAVADVPPGSTLTARWAFAGSGSADLTLEGELY